MSDDNNGTVVEKSARKRDDVQKGSSYYVPYGVLSFADLDAVHTAKKQTNEIDILSWQFQMLVENVMYDDEVADKAAVIKALTEEFGARLDAINSGETLDEFKSADALYETSSKVTKLNKSGFVAKLIKSVIGDDDPNNLFVFKSGDVWRWHATYSNSFIDKDSEPDLVTSGSHRRFVDMVDKGVYPYPKLLIHHEDAWEIGQSDWVAVDEKSGDVVFAVAAGYFHPHCYPIAEAMAKSKVGWRVSHRMPLNQLARSKSNPHHIIEHQTTELSPLIEGAEANPYTGFSVSKEGGGMSISDNKRQAYAAILGPEATKSLLALEEMNNGLAQKAVGEGAEHKSNDKETVMTDVDQEVVDAQAKAKADAATSTGTDTEDDEEEDTSKSITPLSIEDIQKAVAEAFGGQGDINKAQAEVNQQILAQLKALGDRIEEIGKSVTDTAGEMTPAASFAHQLKSAIGAQVNNVADGSELSKGPKETKAKPESNGTTGLVAGIPVLAKALSRTVNGNGG